MKTLHTISEVREALNAQRASGKRISFVPTMGNLHDGHLSLVEEARNVGDFSVVSIFVNPMQFGQNEDLDSYPRTLAADQEKLAAQGVDLLFSPNAKEMYPFGVETQVSVPALSNILCGVTRPVFFTGVATICTKLFNIIQPDVAIFGEKDWQQLTIIRHLVADLCLPLEIRGVATGRAESGLALSSRNGYLSEEELRIAPELFQALSNAKQRILDGDRDYYHIAQQAIAHLDNAGFKHDYVQIVNRDSLQPATSVDKSLVILAAAQLGSARLIDNVLVDLTD